MGFNWDWLSPWALALAHIAKVEFELIGQVKVGNEGAEKLLEDVLTISDRYCNGERTLKLYSDMFHLSLKGIRKYVN